MILAAIFLFALLLIFGMAFKIEKGQLRIERGNRKKGIDRNSGALTWSVIALVSSSSDGKRARPRDGPSKFNYFRLRHNRIRHVLSQWQDRQAENIC